MARIVWLASYPKSGNTWLRFILANLLKGKPIKASTEVGLLVPDIHEAITGLQLFGNRTTIVKTHWAFNSALPLREDVIGVVHLVRNPLDVMESNQSYAMTRSGELYNKTSDSKRQQMASAFIDAFIRDGGHAKFRDFGIGSWEEHTLSWTSKANATPKCLVRYEDLVADPQRQMKRICGFLHLRKTDDEIAAAVKAASREAMQKIETAEIDARREGIFFQTRNAAAYDAGHRFIDRGVGGVARYQPSELQRQGAVQRFAPLMKQLGYLQNRPTNGQHKPK